MTIEVNYSELPLHEFLGMTWEQYQRWVENEEQGPSAALLRDLSMVVKPAGFHIWFNTPIPDLGGLTPLEAFREGKGGEVAKVVKSYLDPSFG